MVLPRHALLLQTGCLLTVLALYASHVTAAQDILRTLEGNGVQASTVQMSMHRVGMERRTGHINSLLPGTGPNNNNNNNGNDFPRPLITEGENAFPKEFKHMAAILIDTDAGMYQICGGVIASPRHVLTAAHCLFYLTGNVTYDHFIMVGVLNITLGLGNPGAQIAGVNNFTIHPDYAPNKNGFPNDIAILHLDQDIVESQYVEFATLATRDDGTFAGATCVVTGWGMTDNGPTDILQFGYQYIPRALDCKNFWAISKAARVTKRHICGYFYPVSTCRGDGGGPLTCDKTVTGLVSWSQINCSGCFPNVYTRISFHSKWIAAEMLGS